MATIWPQILKNAKFLQFFCKFNFTDGLYMAPGPQKVILLGGSLEARLAPHGGHNCSSKKPLQDVPF